MSFSTATGSMSGEKIPSGYRKGQLNNFTLAQQNLFKQLFQNVGPDSYLGKLAQGDQSTFDQMEAPALRQFSELQGNLASRFSNMGIGARRSSGFQNASGQMASNFAQDLASRRQELQRQAINDLMGLSNQLLSQRPYDQFLTPKREKEQGGWGGAVGGGLGAAAGFFASGGNPFAAAQMGQLGYNVGSGF
jgi:hypothetical protein